MHKEGSNENLEIVKYEARRYINHSFPFTSENGKKNEIDSKLVLKFRFLLYIHFMCLMYTLFILVDAG